MLKRRETECTGRIWTLPLDTGGSGRCAFSLGRAAAAASGADRVVDPDPAGTVSARLAHPRRKTPDWVELDAHDDPLRPGDAARKGPALETIAALLRRQVGVTFRTRGGIEDADALLVLARRFPGLLRVEIGMFSTDRELCERWERGCASLGERMELARALRATGAEVVVGIGPLMPFVNDDPKALRALVRMAAAVGVREIVPRFIEAGPGLALQVEREVSRSSARILEGWLRMPGETPGQLAQPVRRRLIDRLRAAGEPLGVRVVACRCHVPWGEDACVAGPSAAVARRQLDLLDLLAVAS